MPRARHSEQHRTVNLDTEVYLTASEIKNLPYFITRHPLFHCPSATVTRSRHPFPAVKLLLAQDGWAESQVRSCYVAARHDPSWLLQAKVPGHALEFISTRVFGEIFGVQGHFQDLSSNEDLHLLLSRLPSFFRDCFFFSETLPIDIALLFSTPSPQFS